MVIKLRVHNGFSGKIFFKNLLDFYFVSDNIRPVNYIIYLHYFTGNGKKHPKSEQDEIVLVVSGKTKDLISYAQVFGLRDRPLQMLFAQNNRRKTKAYVSNVLQRLPEDIVTGLIQERRFDEIAAYLRHASLGLVNEYMLVQTDNRELIGCYHQRWGFRSFMARHYLKENGLVPLS